MVPECEAYPLEPPINTKLFHISSTPQGYIQKYYISGKYLKRKISINNAFNIYRILILRFLITVKKLDISAWRTINELLKSCRWEKDTLFIKKNCCFLVKSWYYRILLLIPIYKSYLSLTKGNIFWST